MTFRMPLELRRRQARNKRDRYISDPDYRLERINASRTAKGLPPVTSLDDVPLRREA